MKKEAKDKIISIFERENYYNTNFAKDLFRNKVACGEIQSVKKDISRAKLCEAGYLWVLQDNSSPYYAIYRCSRGGHWCILEKKPPRELKRKKKRKSEDKLVLTTDGRIVKEKKKKTYEDNVME